MPQINPDSAEKIESSSMWALSEGGGGADAAEIGDTGIEVSSRVSLGNWGRGMVRAALLIGTSASEDSL